VLKRLGQIVAERIELDASMDLIQTNFIRSRPATNAGGIVTAHRPIGDGERFRRAPLAPWRLADDGERVVLFAPGSEMFFTAESRAALERAMDGKDFTLDDLGFEHAEIVVRRLLDYGLVVRA
jgi:hypothetical protein